MLRPNAWIGVELRHFLALDAVATERSFHRAATKLGYTQSAISQQIAVLERVVGEKLVERPGGSQPVCLTRAGEIVMAHAHAIGARVATAQADLQALSAGELDPLRLGFFGRGLGALIAGIHRRLERTRPDVVIRVCSAPTDDELLGMLHRGEVDISFVHLPSNADDCEVTALLEDDYVLVVASDSPIAKRAAPPTLEELAALPLIAFRQGQKECQLTDYFRSHNLRPTWLVGSDDVESIYAFVSAGDGAALLPRLGTISLGGAVRVVDLACGIPPRQIGLAWSTARGASGSAEAFVEAATAEAARFAAKRLEIAS